MGERAVGGRAMKPVDEARLNEASAEVQAQAQADHIDAVIENALEDFHAGRSTWCEYMALVSSAGSASTRVLLRGWSFLDAKRAS